MPSIVTVTFNPALDESTSVERVRADDKLRCREPRSFAGGGGINVARAILRLGGEATAVYPGGGTAGDALEALLKSEGVSGIRVQIAGGTRRNWNVREESTGHEFRFCMPGPELREPEWRACLERLSEACRGATHVVGSGSLPPGAPGDLFARAASVASERGARFFVDSSGEALRAALERGVELAKPSLREFRELTGTDDSVPLGQAAAPIVRGGKCRLLVVSLGREGLFWMDDAGEGRIPSHDVPALSSVGAGDSLMAGIVLALSRGQPVPEAMRFGAAAGAAAVLRTGTELCRLEDVRRLVPELCPPPVEA